MYSWNNTVNKFYSNKIKVLKNKIKRELTNKDESAVKKSDNAGVKFKLNINGKMLFRRSLKNLVKANLLT